MSDDAHNTSAPSPVNWEREARTMLWLDHGCDDGPALYGDDGELQCHKCGGDFLRDPWDILKNAAFLRMLG